MLPPTFNPHITKTKKLSTLLTALPYTIRCVENLTGGSNRKNLLWDLTFLHVEHEEEF